MDKKYQVIALVISYHGLVAFDDRRYSCDHRCDDIGSVVMSNAVDCDDRVFDPVPMTSD